MEAEQSNAALYGNLRLTSKGILTQRDSDGVGEVLFCILKERISLHEENHRVPPIVLGILVAVVVLEEEEEKKNKNERESFLRDEVA